VRIPPECATGRRSLVDYPAMGEIELAPRPHAGTPVADMPEDEDLPGWGGPPRPEVVGTLGFGFLGFTGSSRSGLRRKLVGLRSRFR
jgi:hypothetical protein